MKYNCKDIYDNPDNYSEFLKTSGYLIYLFTNEINNKHYVGDTTVDLEFRLYFNKHWKGHFICYDNGADAHLYNAMRKYGLENFSLEIIYLGEYDETLEGKFIEKYDSFYHGYNESLSGKPFNKASNVLGKIRINNGEIEKWVKPDELEYWEELGFKRGNKPNHGFEGVNKYLDSIPGLRSELAKQAYQTVLTNNDGKHPAVEASKTPEAIAKRLESNKNNHDGVLAWSTPDALEKSRMTLQSKYGNSNGKCGYPEVREKATEKYVFIKNDKYYIMAKNARGWHKNGYDRLCSLNEWESYCLANNLDKDLLPDQR